jgi:flagellar assembly factor FliW
MLIDTSRFGRIEVERDREIAFPKGILGFPNHTSYVLLQPAEDSHFYWLQAADRADLAFVVTDPSLFVTSYRVPLKTEQGRELGIFSIEQAQVFVIVNKRGHVLTGNLQGPLVINVKEKIGEQLVLSDRRFSTRVPLIELQSPVEAVAV